MTSTTRSLLEESRVAVFDPAIQYETRLTRLKRWLWIYFWMLIFEGALRKWVMPSMSGPLLLMRDPVALMVYYRAYQCGKFSMKRFWPFAVLAGAMGLLACAQLANGIITVPIALYGLRSYALHPALMFVMADTLDEEDISKFGRWLMLLSIPMFFLVLAQFNAASSSWLNAGAGENSGQIASAAGHIRPAGTFSYGIGMQSFEVLLAGFALDALMRKGRYPAWLVYWSLFAVVAMIPLLGSRSVLFSMAILAGFVLFSGMSRGARLVRFTKVLVLVLLAAVVALQFPFFHEASAVMSERWEQASYSEGDVGNALDKRVLGPIGTAFDVATNMPWLGKGIGIGSNFAAATLTGQETFLAGEGEWQRVVYEFGPVLGLLFLAARVALAVYVMVEALRSLRGNSVLAWLLVPAVIPLMLLTIMEQATYLGFMVFGGGLCLAAVRIEKAAIWQASLYPERSF